MSEIATREAAEVVGVHKSMLLRYMHAGRISPSRERNGAFWFKREDTERLRDALESERLAEERRSREFPHAELVCVPICPDATGPRDLLSFVYAYQQLTRGRHPSLRTAAQALGISAPTVRNWMTTLEQYDLIDLDTSTTGSATNKVHITAKGMIQIDQLRVGTEPDEAQQVAESAIVVLAPSAEETPEPETSDPDPTVEVVEVAYPEETPQPPPMNPLPLPDPQDATTTPSIELEAL
jgi:hypothetical protein